jgi:hypothetical protein
MIHDSGAYKCVAQQHVPYDTQLAHSPKLTVQVRGEHTHIRTPLLTLVW